MSAPVERGFFRYTLKAYGLGFLAALPLAFHFAANFKPRGGAPMSHAAWLLSYLPSGALRYWPHELGHVVAGAFFNDRFLVVAGGTGLEVFLPLGLLVFAVAKRETLLSWLFMLWLGYALLDVAYYMADAAHPAMQYVRPFDARAYSAAEVKDSHDWVFMLKACGALDSAVSLARTVYFAGVMLLWMPFLSLGGDFAVSLWQYRQSRQG